MKIKIFYFTLLLVSIQTFSQITNEGILKISDGTTVYFGEDYTNKAGATHDNEGNLHLNGDLINNGTMSLSADPDTANGFTYFDSPTNTSSTTNLTQQITGTEVVNFENLVVNMTDANSFGVLVEDEMQLVVEKSVTLTNGDLRLIDEAQLIQMHTGTNENSGLGHLLRDQQGTVNTYNYNYWSSPVTGNGGGTYTIEDILRDGSDSNVNDFSPSTPTYSTGTPWNGTPSVLDGSGFVTTPLNLETYWMYKFDNGDIDDDNDWFLMRNTGAYQVGLGFTMKGAGAITSDQNFVFKGQPNDGNYSFVIGTNKSYLLGNPYPSSLDANIFITNNAAVFADVNTPSATTGAIYYWEHWGGNSHSQANYQGGYATYTLAGGTPPTTHPDVSGGGANSGINGSRYIPVAQGFFVESNTGGNIIINNSQRVFKLEDASSFFRSSDNNSTFLTKNEEDTMQRIRLGYNSPEGFYRQIMTTFISECSDGHNIAYDARMAYIHNDEMFWVTNGVPYVIDARPFGIEKQIPIGIKVAEAGIHKIFLFDVENFDNDIYILDTNTGYTTDIKITDFEVALEVGEYLDRFKLVFQEHSPLDVENILQENLQVFYTNTLEEIVIKNPTNLEIKSVTIYNTIGQLIHQISKEKLSNTIEIRTPFNVASGTYFIRIDTNIGKGAFKIIAY